MGRSNALFLLCAALVLVSCERSTGSGDTDAMDAAYTLELQQDWPERGDGFRLVVQPDGRATVQAQPWDARARFAPAPIVALERFAPADLALLRELFALELPEEQAGAPRPALHYPAAELRWYRGTAAGIGQQRVDRLYQTHLPELPASLFAAVDRIRALVGESADGDWESTAELEHAAYTQGKLVRGGARFVYRGADEETLHFGSGCQFQRVLIDEAGTEYPELQMCTLALTELKFVHGQGRSFALDFDSANPPEGWPRDELGRLPVGRYTLRGVLERLDAEVDFEILPAD